MKSPAVAAGTLLASTLAFANPSDHQFAHKNLLINGNFDLDAPTSGCLPGTTTVPGWQVTTGNVDIDSDTTGCSGIASAVGMYFIDLTGEL